MTAFRGYMLLIFRNLQQAIGYFAAFAAIAILMSRLDSPADTVFKAEAVSITVVDQDNSTLSKELTEFLKIKNNVTIREYDKEELTRDMYARFAEYILVIPEGFESDYAEGGTDVQLKVTKLPGSQEGMYIDSQIENYLRQTNLYKAAGFSLEESAQKALVLNEKDSNVTLAQTSERQQVPAALRFMQYIPYLYLSVLCLSMCNIMKPYHDKELKRRLMASAVSPVKQTLSALAAFAILFAGVWVLSMLLPLIGGFPEFYSDPNIKHFIINSLCLLVSSGAIAFLLANIVKEDHAIAAMNNIVTLGMCFLCGVFVPLQLLGEGVQNAAKFLPVYWFEKNHLALSGTTVLSADQLAEVNWGYLIMLLFSGACILITLVIRKKKT